jgi:hypothetical protein
VAQEWPAALNDDTEKHRDRLWTSHTDENYINVEGFIKEDRRATVRGIAAKTVLQYYTFLGKQLYREGVFKFVKR